MRRKWEEVKNDRFFSYLSASERMAKGKGREREILMPLPRSNMAYVASETLEKWSMQFLGRLTTTGVLVSDT